MTPFNKSQIEPSNLASCVEFTSGGVVLNMNAESYEAAETWLQLHDKASGHPANGDIPMMQWRIAALGTKNYQFPGPSPQQLVGQAFASGCVFAWSSTRGTLTYVVTGGIVRATGVYVP